MKNLKKNIVLLLLISISMISCGDEEKKPENSEKQESQLVVPEVDVDFENAELEKAFQMYLNLKNALVKTDPEEAKNAALQLQEALSEVDTNEELLQATKKISAVDDIHIQRDNFQIVSEEMTNLVQEEVKSGAVYQQYCPMAFEGKGGYWLSTSKEIRNPYYGDKMLKCGAVEKTFD